MDISILDANGEIFIKLNMNIMPLKTFPSCHQQYKFDGCLS